MSWDGAILAGGAGLRMGGADKGLLDWHGEPLVARIAAQLRPQVSRLWISANRHLEQYQRYGQVVVDAVPGRGPLEGLLALRQASDADWLITVPCDSWPLPDDLAQRMVDAAEAAQCGLSVFVQGQDVEWCVQAVHRALLPDLAAARAQDVRSMHGWCSRHACVRVAYAAEPRWFRNLNTPQDWAAALADLPKKKGADGAP